MKKKKSKKIVVSEEYQEFQRILQCVYDSVTKTKNPNPLRYRKDYELLKDYFGRVGEDTNIDWNLIVLHLIQPTSPMVINVFETVPEAKQLILVTENSGLVNKLNDVVSIREAFTFLESVYDFYSPHEKQMKDGRHKIIKWYIEESIMEPAEHYKVALLTGHMKDLVARTVANRYIKFGEKIGVIYGVP